MSRYIDADALKERLIQNITLTNAIDKSFSEAPSIDIVFCKECEYCVNGQCWKTDGLDKLDGNVADDDFCSRGERKESE